VVIGGVHSYLAVIGFKTPLHATTYLTIPLEPIEMLSHIHYCPIIIHKKFQRI